MARIVKFKNGTDIRTEMDAVTLFRILSRFHCTFIAINKNVYEIFHSDDFLSLKDVKTGAIAIVQKGSSHTAQNACSAFGWNANHLYIRIYR